MLRSLPPFKRWKLPDVDDVTVHISTGDCDGLWWVDKKKQHHIRVSAKRHDTLETVIRTIAHEMTHLRFTPNEGAHGREWNRAADQVCRQFKWDRGQF